MTTHPALMPGWRCESCASGSDCPCASWLCQCRCQASPHPLDPAIRRVDEIEAMTRRLLELDERDRCQCGGAWVRSVGLDELDGERATVRVVVECDVCGREQW